MKIYLDFKIVPHIFNNTIGVNFSHKIELVKLLVSNELLPYFETLPFHNSQKTIEVTEKGKVISIEVGINYELERWILYYGSNIEVLEPQSLRSKIEKLLKNNLNLYQTNSKSCIF
jgi:WYL domain